MLLVILFLSQMIGFGQNLGYISVKDFGAKGDGKTDDTESIIKAIKNSESKSVSTNQLNGRNLAIYGGLTPTVYFPAGVYLISKKINFATYVSIAADKAIMTPSTEFAKSSDFAFSLIGWQCKIAGLQFIGFKNAVEINNNNLDAGKIEIDNCDFIENQTAIKLTAQSSISIIHNSRFYNNQKVLIIERGDKVIFEENWVTSGNLAGDNDAQIINKAVLNFYNNLLVPTPPQKGAREPAWINNFGSLIVENTRQGGEPGSFTLVNNFAEAETKYPLIPTSVVIKNSDCYAVYRTNGNMPEPAVLRLYALPNQIVLEDIRGMVDATLVGVSKIKAENPDSWVKNRKYSKNYVKIRVKNIVGGFPEDNNTHLPSYLTSFVEDEESLLTQMGRDSGKKAKISPQARSTKDKYLYEYQFEPQDLESNYLIDFSANPNVYGSGAYRKGYVAIFRVDGTYVNGQVVQQLVLKEIFNGAGDKTPNESKFEFDVNWKSTKSRIKPVDNSDNTIIITVKGSSSGEKINIINLNLIR